MPKMEKNLLNDAYNHICMENDSDIENSFLYPEKGVNEKYVVKCVVYVVSLGSRIRLF